MALTSLPPNLGIAPDRYELRERDLLQQKQRQFYWDQPAIVTRNGRDYAPGVWSDLPPPTDFGLPANLSPWDFLWLGDGSDRVRAPGIARIDGGRHCNFDLKSAIGQLVPQATFLNFDPVPIL